MKNEKYWINKVEMDKRCVQALLVCFVVREAKCRECGKNGYFETHNRSGYNILTKKWGPQSVVHRDGVSGIEGSDKYPQTSTWQSKDERGCG